MLQSLAASKWNPMGEEDPLERATQIIDRVKGLGIAAFIKPEDICDGNVKLNMGLLAQIFNKRHGLFLPTRGLNGTPQAGDYPTVEIAQALQTVLEQARPLGVEPVHLVAVHGRVGAQDMRAGENYPPHRTSAVTGYAVVGPLDPGRYGVKGKTPTGGVVGALSGDELQVAYVTAGAKIPDGATGVVRLEDTEALSGPSNGDILGGGSGSDGGGGGRSATGGAFTGASVYIKEVVPLGTNVRDVGSDLAAGGLIIKGGQPITPSEVGLLATAGVTTVLCHRKPVIGVLSTGRDLVDSSVTPTGSQVRDNNRAALMAAFKQDGYECVDLGIASDSPSELEGKLLDGARRCDVVVTSGGVSASGDGDAATDYLKPVLGKIGTLHFGQLSLRPNDPATFATIEGVEESSERGSSGGTDRKKKTVVFALSSDSVSCLVAKALLVDPALRRLEGRSHTECMHTQITAIADADIELDPEGPSYHRAALSMSIAPTTSTSTSTSTGSTQSSTSDIAGSAEGGEGTTGAGTGAGTGAAVALARVTGDQQSNTLTSMRSTNAYLCLPAGQGRVERGTPFLALLTGPLPPPTSADAFYEHMTTRVGAEIAISNVPQTGGAAGGVEKLRSQKGPKGTDGGVATAKAVRFGDESSPAKSATSSSSVSSKWGSSGKSSTSDQDGVGGDGSGGGGGPIGGGGGGGASGVVAVEVGTVAEGEQRFMRVGLLTVSDRVSV